MNIQSVAISKLNPAKYNPRKDLTPEDPEYQKLAKSIKEFNYIDPIIWNKRSGNVVGGHQRLKILKANGRKKLDVSVVDLPDNKEKALNLALNKHSGAWDYPKLKDLIIEIDVGDIDIEVTGFDENELENIFGHEVEDLEGEWEGMPEFIREPLAHRTIHIHFKTADDVLEFEKIIGLGIKEKTKYLWFPENESE